MHTAVLHAAPLQFMPATALARTTSASPIKTQCSTCHLKDLCLPCGLTGNDVQRLDGLKFARRRVKEGDALYREGDKFQFIYAVRARVAVVMKRRGAG